MKLSPPRLVVAIASPDMNSNAKRSMQATVQHRVRPMDRLKKAIIQDRAELAAWMINCLNVAGEKRQK